MERFATNKNGNIDSRTEVLANNITFIQQAKENAISNLFGDLFVEGILNTGNESTMFKLTANGDGTFNVSQGIAYKQNVAVEPMIYERIAIIDDTEIYDATKPQQTTDDGTGNLVITPKSTGCKNIPITNADTIYYVDLRYLSVCDNKDSNDDLINYSIAKNLDNSNTQEKRFYKWVDGYQIVLVQGLQFIQGVCLGSVSKNSSNQVTISYENRADSILIESSVFMDYFTSGSGITITEEEGKKQLAINVDDKTIEIADNKVQISNNGLYPYTKFSVNSGFIDSNNNPNILGTDGTDIALSFSIGNQAPIVVSPAYNRQYTILPTDNYDFVDDAGVVIQNYYGETANGIYTICINDTDKDNDNVKLEKPKLEIMKKVYISETVPTALKGNIWLDTSVEPFRAKWYNGFEWLEYHGVPLGDATINGTTVNSVVSYSFNVPTEKTIALRRARFYNFESEVERITAYLDSASIFHLDYSKGLAFYSDVYNTNGAISLENNIMNIKQFDSIQINGQPVPRLPDYSAHTQLYGSSGDSRTITIQNDGWLFLRGGGSGSYYSINGFALLDNDWGYTTPVIMGLPVKKGDTVSFKYTVLTFCPYR